MEAFELGKKNTLTKQDKSRIGRVDDKIKHLCDLINSLNNYYTTSSCSGRIVLRKDSGTGKKNESEWIFVTHKKAAPEEVNKALINLPKEDVWLVMESLILHVCCNTIEDAQKMLDMFKNEGFKRSGITGIKPKIMLEIIGTERLDCIVGKNGVRLIDNDHLKILIEEANSKLEKSWKKLEKIENKIKELKK
jgi:tRNA wybutosine-synthesizing protein 3